MKLNPALALAAAVTFAIPANNAAADESRSLSDQFDRVHFNPDNGRLRLNGPDKLSSIEREYAVVSVLYGFRGLIDDCLESGTPGNASIGPKAIMHTVHCGEESSVTSCTFKESRTDSRGIKIRVTCQYPNDRTVILEHNTAVWAQYVGPTQDRIKAPRAIDECFLPTGCRQQVTKNETSFIGTNRPPKMIFRSSVVESESGLVEALAGQDSFGGRREYYTELIEALYSFFSGIKSKFLEKINGAKPSPIRKRGGWEEIYKGVV